MSESRRLRLGPTRAGVLQHLRTIAQAAPVADVAAAVGLHQNTTRFHLDALAAAGLVERQMERRDHPGRPKVLYQATRGHRDNRRYQDLAQVMVRHFAGGVDDVQGRARAAGVSWGDELRADLEHARPEQAPLERLVEVMRELGYSPELKPGRDPVVELTPCPYGRLASDSPLVVCQLHLGLVDGLLGPACAYRVQSLEPWATPTTCVLRLASGAADGEPADPEVIAPGVSDVAEPSRACDA